MILYASSEGGYFQHVVNDQTINLFNESIKRKMDNFICSRVTLYNIILRQIEQNSNRRMKIRSISISEYY